MGIQFLKEFLKFVSVYVGVWSVNFGLNEFIRRVASLEMRYPEIFYLTASQACQSCSWARDAQAISLERFPVISVVSEDGIDASNDSSSGVASVVHAPRPKLM
jgi:hypothetical protein